MSCYRPMVGCPTGEKTRNGKPVYSWSYSDPLQAKLTYPDCIVVPCGKCLGCRLDYAHKWSDRMILELQCHDRACFVTLTYSDEELPLVYDEESGSFAPTLYKRHVQLFLKRLRRAFPDREITYFLAGEYGGLTHRPHYHVILYDIGIDDFLDLEYYKSNELHQPMFISRKFEEIWTHGQCTLACCTYETCNYTARYVTKKAYSSAFEDGRQEEFCLMSRNPAIGKRYLDQHPECLDKEYIFIGTERGSIKVSIPKYFLDKSEEQFPDKVQEIRKRKRELNQEDLIYEARINEVKRLRQLRIDEAHTEQVTRCLTRNKL